MAVLPEIPIDNIYGMALQDLFYTCNTISLEISTLFPFIIDMWVFPHVNYEGGQFFRPKLI